MDYYWKQEEQRREARAKWLAGLKVGDEVAINRGWRGFGWEHVPSLCRVSSATATIIRVQYREGDTLEFNRETGRERGRGNRSELNEVTATVRELVRLRDALDEFETLSEKHKRVKWAGFSAGQIEQINLLLKGGTP